MEGYYDDLEQLQAIERKSTDFIVAALGVKKSIVSLWPLFSDPKPEKVEPITPEEQRRLEQNLAMLLSKRAKA